MLKPPLAQLPMPKLGERVSFIGNTGEGKSVVASALLSCVKHGIILNTKGDPFFKQFGPTISGKNADEKIMRVTEGMYNYIPSDAWKHSKAMKDRFFAWLLAAGNRVCYVDEWDDVVDNSQNCPQMVKKCIRQGRWKHLSIWGASQEWAYVPRFCFSQSQWIYIFYTGNPDHRVLASRWVQAEIPWEAIPEFSHKFLIKSPSGVYGPQPRLNITSLNERLSA